jgi:hypothetical protein
MSINQKLEPSVQSNISFLYYVLGSLLRRSDLSYLRDFNLQRVDDLKPLGSRTCTIYKYSSQKQ